MLWYCGQRIVERPRTPVESSFAKNRTMSTSPIPGPAPVYEDYARCIHCGLCLNACPTYRLWNLEADSPRGRIHQMIHVELGNFPVTDSFVDHIDKCLDCRACETACPSGVEYGKLVELARVLRLYQRSGLQAVARAIGVLKLLGLSERERFLPRIDDDFFYGRHGRTYPAVGPRRARVAFFAGCIANVAFARLNESTIRVLTSNGCEVVVPKGQLCCGALSAHAGIRDVARELAGTNLAVFLREDFDAIVTNAAGCGSALKEYDHLFSPEEPEFARAREFSAKVRDVTEFLAALGLAVKLKPLPLRVTYQDSCHLLHGQKIREAPRTLLRAIPGLEFVELPSSEICCGSAGVYNVTQTETSLELLAEKMQHAQSTRAPIIATANPGCLLQLRAGAAIHHTNQQVLHVVELLDRAIP